MINLELAKEQFRIFSSQYNASNGRIELKIIHTFRVMTLCERIAKELGFPDDDIKLAMLIGLLHDVGRFEQVRIYNTFQDSISVDHAKLGTKMLFEDGLIRKFIQDSQYDDIILKAISNHNKYEIDNLLDDRTLLFARLIRDADKADIFRTICVDTFQNTCMSNIQNPYPDSISDSIYADFMNEKSIRWDSIRTPLDRIISHLAFIYDFNFLPGLYYAEEQGFLTYIFDKIVCEEPLTAQRWKNMQEKVIEYMNYRLKK